MQSELRSPNHGFFGASSFAAVYAEDQSLGELQSPSGQELNYAKYRPPDMNDSIRQGASLLVLLRDLPTYKPLVRTWKAQNPLSMISAWVIASEGSVQEIYINLNAALEGQDHSILLESSARIFENSFKALTLNKDCTFDQFADMINGQQLRWESVGMYFTAIGLAIMTIDDYQLGELGKLGSADRDLLGTRRRLGKKMLEASDACKSFCETAGQLTDPESWLYTENAHLCTLVAGDASYLPWRRLGDSVSICVAKGLHGEIRPSESVPFWLSELRKRQFAVTYNMDKSTSSFLGRPPRLLRKYCSMQLPLDLDLEQLRLPPAELAVEISKLDSDGWNTEGSFRGNVYTRATLICHIIIEDIQELMLWTLPEHSAEYAQDILSRSQDAWSNLPSFIRNAPRNPLSSVAQDYLPSAIKILFWHNEFLLQRFLVQGLSSSNQELIRISRIELSTVLELMQLHNTGRHAVDMSWFIAKFALPAAGILALELLRQSQGQPMTEAFHRSEVVQNLSSLIAALKWTASKQAANYDICNYARPVLQKILDIVLSPRQEQSLPQNDLADDIEMSTEFNLLNQTHSEVDFWSLLPQHPLLLEHR